ncbi:MAG: hypothetical protein ACXAD7_07200 [Candidatus Kariarchaeaceae archaeon]|jgi:Arc/MetJ-type ribon-helix-helix transcriptional regulator
MNENEENEIDIPHFEKISLNVAISELGRIDALIEAGYASNRTEFIRQSIRKELSKYKVEIEAIAPRTKFRGVIMYLGKGDVDGYLEKGEKIDIRVLGYLRLARNIRPEDLEAIVNSCKVYGSISAPKELKQILLRKRPKYSLLGNSYDQDNE